MSVKLKWGNSFIYDLHFTSIIFFVPAFKKEDRKLLREESETKRPKTKNPSEKPKGLIIMAPEGAKRRSPESEAYRETYSK